MHDLIRHTLERVAGLLTPRPHGRHRARPVPFAPHRPSVPPAPPQAGPVWTARTAHRPATPQSGAALPRAGSPYGLDRPLDGDEVALVRPYLAAHEERRQARRRRALVWATLGIDTEPLRVHGPGPVLEAAR